MIDLSYENVMRTKMMHKKKLKDFTPTYPLIELIEMNENGDLDSLKIHKGLFRFSDLKKQMGERKILSIHDYDDTHTTSICLERE